MPAGRPRTDLDSWKQTITDWINEDHLRQSEVLEKLEIAGLSISRTTLTRSLQAWGIRKSAPTKPPPGPDLDQLQDRARFFFTNLGLPDARAAETLRTEGFAIGDRAVSSMRREMGLYRRIPIEDQERAAEEIRDALREEYNRGRINCYGRKHLATHMRRTYNTVGRSVYYSSSQATIRY